MRPSALLRRVWRAQLRLKVMAGVVVVTLAALTAFDIGAVTMMRRYLLGQTDNNLAAALAVTKIQLRLLDAGYFPVSGQPPFRAKVPRVKGPPGGPPPSILGEFDIAYLPDKGKQFPLEVGANGIGMRIGLPSNLAKIVTKAGLQTVVSQNGETQLRVDTEMIPGGSLVAATSLDQVDEVMRRITLETRRMGRLVDDMLRLARLGQHPSQGRVPVDLTALVSGCVERARVAEPDRAWQVTIAESLTTVGDEELIRRAVDNLLANVLVHTPRDAIGTLTACRDTDQVTIEVRDDGEGVPPEQLPRVFERFYRAGSRPSVPGSGLGLAIAAEIAIAHGGTARAATASPRGLQVTLTFPAHFEKSENPNQGERTWISPCPPVTVPPG
jgi:hypothetical protein